MIPRSRSLSFATFLMLVPLLAAQPAGAFCGFYVAKADGKLFNKASKVVVARRGEHTTITMASDYQGDPKEFALVVPVPTMVAEDQIKVVENAWVDHLDAYSAPRLVEYFDPDPCRGPSRLEMVGGRRSAELPAEDVRKNPKALGVSVEAQYTVGEYDIAILSATQSDGLVEWLNDSGYKVPSGAAPVLGSYIRQGMKFFIAKVNISEQGKFGYQYLRPIQVSFTTNKFMLPIRLGTVNADGPQDMIVLMLTEKGRVETTNYRSVRVPSDVDVPTFTKLNFGKVYRAMFDEQVKKDDMRGVYLEYAWDAGSCDPCAANPLPYNQLVELGAFWLNLAAPAMPSGIRSTPTRTTNVFVTRLHVRYDGAHFPEDLMFQETADRSNFQARYVLRHPFTGSAQCAAGELYRRFLDTRLEREAVTLSNLTGWSADAIKDLVRLGKQPIQ